MNIDEALIERIIREVVWLKKRLGADRMALLQEIIRTVCNQ